MEQWIRRDIWHAEQIGYLMTRMSTIMEADGSSMLDNTLIVWCSEIARGNTHSHRDMEIISYVLEGALAHRDDTGGTGGVIRPGELQWMGAGHGVQHSEYNGSDSEPVHFLQIWIQPDRVNAAPAWDSRPFPLEDRLGRWALLASPDGAEGSLAIRQQASLHGVRLGEGESVITRGGERLGAGWVRIVRSGAAQQGALLREREIQELRTEIAQLQHREQELDRGIVAWRDRLLLAEQQREDAQRAAYHGHRSVSELAGQLQGQQGRLDASRARIERIDEELAQIASTVDGGRDQSREARARQEAAVGKMAELEQARQALDAERRELAARRDELCDGLDIAGFTVFRPQGTYFVTVDIRPLRADGDGMAFCRALPGMCGVVAIPNQVFYGDPARGRYLVRFAFAKRAEVIHEAVARLGTLAGAAA